MFLQLAPILLIILQVEPDGSTPIWLPILIIVILLLFLWWGLTRNNVPEESATHTHDAHSDDGHGHDTHAIETDAHDEATAVHTATAEEHSEPVQETPRPHHEGQPDPITVPVPEHEPETDVAVNLAPPSVDPPETEQDAPPRIVAAPEPEPQTQDSGAAHSTPPVTATSTESDDLKKIEGIGPKIEGVLHDAGITTFTQLSRTSVEDLVRIVKTEGKVRIAFPDSWPEQAELAAAGRWDELEQMQDQLTAGRKR